MRIRALLLLVCLAAPAIADPRAVALSGSVVGASGKHAVYVAVWRRDGFLERPAAQVRLDPGVQPSFRFEVTPGSWALSAFEDRNDNGTLDMGLFGPQEPSGFWRKFTAWRKPRFDDVAAVVDRDTPHADIALH